MAVRHSSGKRVPCLYRASTLLLASLVVFSGHVSWESKAQYTYVRPFPSCRTNAQNQRPFLIYVILMSVSPSPQKQMFWDITLLVLCGHAG